MKPSTYLKWRNWLFVPAVEVLCVFTVGNMLSIEITWQLWVLISFAIILSDIIDGICEGRPVAGPYRWRQRDGDK